MLDYEGGGLQGRAHHLVRVPGDAVHLASRVQGQQSSAPVTLTLTWSLPDIRCRSRLENTTEPPQHASTWSHTL